MKHALLFRSARTVPQAYRSNFIHLFLDIAWFGLLNGSSIAFVAVYAARLGATPLQLGLVTAGPAMVNLLVTLPSGRWLEGQEIGKAVFWTSVFHRMFYLLWAVLPIFLGAHLQIWALIGLTLLMSIPGTGLAVGFNALFADSVPPEWRAYVAGVRNALLAISLIVTSLLCGVILNTLPFPMGYQIVFALGFLGAALSSFHLWYVRPLPDSKNRPPTGRAIGDFARPGSIRTLGDASRPAVGLRYLTQGTQRLLRIDILTGPFGRIVAVLFAFHLAQYLAIPLFPIYYVDKLHLTDFEISLGSVIFYVLVLLGSTQLAGLVETLSNQRVMAIGALVLGGYPAVLAVSQGVAGYWVASIVGGVAWGMVNGALGNYVLDRVSPTDRPACLAWYNLAFNAAILLASLAGPLLADVIGLSTALMIIALWRFLAALSIWRWG
ncbi:MAG: MFS transporter [Anaerolineae bacterium]|nr:MFS transporter [Anaerolineae bacterium]